jgi:hypothetical protein
LREIIADKTGYPINSMRLICGTSELTDKDNSSLDQVGIHNLSTVFVVFRLLGGATIEFNVQLFRDRCSECAG